MFKAYLPFLLLVFYRIYNQVQNFGHEFQGSQWLGPRMLKTMTKAPRWSFRHSSLFITCLNCKAHFYLLSLTYYSKNSKVEALHTTYISHVGERMREQILDMLVMLLNVLLEDTRYYVDEFNIWIYVVYNRIFFLESWVRCIPTLMTFNNYPLYICCID